MNIIDVIKQSCELYNSVHDEKIRQFLIGLIQKLAGEL